jgi:hypothetical protein
VRLIFKIAQDLSSVAGLSVDLGGMLDIIPISRPNAQNLKSPLPAISLHLRDHAAHHARG